MGDPEGSRLEWQSWCQVTGGVSPAQKLLVRARSWGLCSFHLKSVPALGSPTPVPYLHATTKCLSPFFTPRWPKPGAWQRQRPDKVTSQLPSVALGPRRAVPRTCRQEGDLLELVLKQASFPKCQVRRGKNGRDPWGAQSTNHCPFRAFLLRSLPRGQQDRPEQGWEEKAGPSAERIPLGRDPLAQGLQPFWRWGALAFAWPTWGYTQAEGLTGPQLLLGSEQRRPRCVCRPEVKQMTFIGKAVFFSTMFICQKNRLSTKGCLLEKMKTACCQFSLVEKKSALATNE